MEEGEEGYNSEDEYSHVGQTLTEEEWVEKDDRFERIMGRKGLSGFHYVLLFAHCPIL